MNMINGKGVGMNEEWVGHNCSMFLSSVIRTQTLLEAGMQSISSTASNFMQHQRFKGLCLCICHYKDARMNLSVLFLS